MSKTIREYFGLNTVTGLDCSKYYKPPSLVETIESQMAVGIEVEIENHQLRHQPNGNVWVIKGDGSLRNNGVEYVSVPIQASWAPVALQDLLENALDKSCCFSPRTSIHVHLDMQQWEARQALDMLLMYTVFEGLFYKFTGRGRIKNIYCVPLFDTGMLASCMSKQFSTTLQGWSKYTGLNIIPLQSFGTFEFRHMHGTFDVRKVSIWIRLITKLAEYVRRTGTEAIQKILQGEMRNVDYREWIREIWGMDSEYLKFESYEDVRKGVDAMKTAFVDGKYTSQLVKRVQEVRGPYFDTSKKLKGEV